MSEPIGNLLDSLGVEVTRNEGELFAGAVVLLKVVAQDGSVTLRTCASEGMSWIERVGMFRIADIHEEDQE